MVGQHLCSYRETECDYYEWLGSSISWSSGLQDSVLRSGLLYKSSSMILDGGERTYSHGRGNTNTIRKGRIVGVRGGIIRRVRGIVVGQVVLPRLMITLSVSTRFQGHY